MLLKHLAVKSSSNEQYLKLNVCRSTIIHLHQYIWAITMANLRSHVSVGVRINNILGHLLSSPSYHCLPGSKDQLHQSTIAHTVNSSCHTCSFHTRLQGACRSFLRSGETKHAMQ